MLFSPLCNATEDVLMGSQYLNKYGILSAIQRCIENPVQDL